MKRLFLIIIISTVFQLASFSQSCLPEGIIFTTQAQIDNFQADYPGCNVIEGNVYIGAGGPNNNISNLNGLSSITSILGELRIRYIFELQNLDGLDNLTYIGGNVEFTWNKKLTNIDGFSKLDTINGELFVRYSFFDDLTGFARLKYIAGNVRIVQNTGIDNYEGFDSLKVIGGSFDVADNENIYDVAGFNSIDSIYGRLYLRHPEATSISGFNNLKYVGGNVIFEECDMLNSISGFSELNYIGNDFRFVNNFQLTNVNAFNALDSIGGSLVYYQAPMLSNSNNYLNLIYIGGEFEISYCNSFSELTDFQHLQSVGGGIRIYNNDSLLSLSSLESLTSVGGNLVIYFNDILPSLTGLENINPNSISSIEITYNPLLSECNIPPLCNYLSSPNGSVKIYHNSTGCNKAPEIASSCGFSMPCLPYGYYYFFNQNDIDSFQSDYPGCSELEGYVQIRGNDIYDLQGLNVVNTINGTFEILGNHYLFVLTGLNNLTSIGGDFVISGNSSLADLTGLDLLDHIGGRFKVWQNASLQNFDGIESLMSINSSLTIYSNDRLENLSALSNISSLGGHLHLSYNDLLKDLMGLSSLTTLDGELSIYGNSALESLQGLDNINANSIQNLSINGNEKLSECEVKSICDYIADPNGSINIEFNASGCNSYEEVDSACYPVSIDDPSESPYLLLYPNPAKNLLNIESNEAIREVRLYNPLGEMVLKVEIGNSEGQIDVSRLKNGLYFVEVVTESGEWQAKVVVN